MQYTVWSGERLIGVTDLGFLYHEGGSCTGWFHPSTVGEPLMPEIVEPLIGNYMDRRRRTADEPMTKEEWARLDDYELARARVARWNLRIRRDDGSLVPTDTVAIRDMNAFLSCYGPHRETWEDDMDGLDDLLDDDPSERWKRDAQDDVAEAALRRDIEHDVMLIEEWFEEQSHHQEWAPEDDEPLPRYQIWVLLSDPSSVS